MERTFWQRNRVAGIFLVLVVLTCLAAVIYPTLMPGRRGDQKLLSCISNIKQTSNATLMYMSDSDGRMPLAKWMDGLSPDHKLRYMMGCPPFTQDRKPYGFALKLGLAGKSETQINANADTVMFLETDIPGDNVVADLSQRSPRHTGASNVGFFDGHARYLPLDAPLK